MIKGNLGGFDRAVRLVLGMMLFMFSLCLMVALPGHFIGLVIAAVGLFLLVTGALRFCPLYLALGVSTVGRSLYFRGCMERMMAGCCGPIMKDMNAPYFSHPGETKPPRSGKEDGSACS